MPSFAYVRQNIHCPFCNSTVHNLTAFQWGFCPGYNIQEKYVYKLGDSIYWKICHDGSIPSWAYFDERQGNIGDPTVLDLIVRDSSHYWHSESKCFSCQQKLGGAAVQILKGVVQCVWIYKPSELDNSVDIYLIMPDTSLKPMPNWNDHQMRRVVNC